MRLKGAAFSFDPEVGQQGIQAVRPRGEMLGGFLQAGPDHSWISGVREAADSDNRQAVDSPLPGMIHQQRLDLFETGRGLIAQELQRQVDAGGPHPAHDAAPNEARQQFDLLAQLGPERRG